MKKFAGVTKEQVDKELKFIARHSTGYRFVGTYEEVKAHCELYKDEEYDYVKDVDLLYSGGQNPDMQRFMAAMEEVDKQTGTWHTISQIFDEFGQEE